jgi:predicted dehydrogenase
METRIGILGVGGFGFFCMEQYLQMPGVRVTVIGGTKPEKYARLAEQYRIPHFVTDWRALVSHPEVDVVYLATPPFLRGEPAIAAFQAGKHVFCEKPLALSLAEADAMLRAAAEHERRLGINFVMRYSRLYAVLAAIVREGLLGVPQRLVFENLAADLPAAHWFWDPARSGTIPVEHGVHFFDIFAAMLGPGTVCWAARGQRASGAEDRWLAALRYADILATFYHAFATTSPLERTWCVLECARGRVRLEEWIPVRLRLEGQVSASEATRLRALLPEATVREEQMDGGPWLASGETINADRLIDVTADAGDKQAIYADAVREAMADFLAWTRDPAHQPQVTGADGRAALDIALQVRELARER